MSKTGSSKIFIRGDYKRKSDGFHPIYIRIIIKKERKDISLDEWCRKKDWNKNTCRVKNTAENSFNVNTILDVNDKKARDIFFDYKKEKKSLTMSVFLKHFNDKTYNSESFYDFMDQVMATNQNTLKKSTQNTYLTQISKLKKFREPLALGEMDRQFIDEYTNYMVGLGNNKNTISKARAWLKAQLNRAVDLKKIDKNSVDHIEVSRIEGNREFLTFEEQNILELMLLSDGTKQNLKNVLKYFLFCCYTGLRYSDIKEFRYKDIKDGSTISIVMQKTDEPVKIPLINKAKNLIGKGLPNEKVFRVYTDQPTNRYLKDIMGEAKINKRISFHCARHTFATSAIRLGIPIEVVSKILGHTEIGTTQIYARIEDPLKEKEMQKFNIPAKTPKQAKTKRSSKKKGSVSAPLST